MYIKHSNGSESASTAIHSLISIEKKKKETDKNRAYETMLRVKTLKRTLG